MARDQRGPFTVRRIDRFPFSTYSPFESHGINRFPPHLLHCHDSIRRIRSILQWTFLINGRMKWDGSFSRKKACPSPSPPLSRMPSSDFLPRHPPSPKSFETRLHLFSAICMDVMAVQYWSDDMIMNYSMTVRMIFITVHEEGNYGLIWQLTSCKCEALK